VALTVGDLDSKETLSNADFIMTTSEKLDSLIRHHSPWIRHTKTVIIDEIHLLNDPGRGPTLEILITMLRKMLPKLQIIGLSATIGNPEELAKWLDAKLVVDDWRPVKLTQHVYLEGELTFPSPTIVDLFMVFFLLHAIRKKRDLSSFLTNKCQFARAAQEFTSSFYLALSYFHSLRNPRSYGCIFFCYPWP